MRWPVSLLAQRAVGSALVERAQAKPDHRISLGILESLLSGEEVKREVS